MTIDIHQHEIENMLLCPATEKYRGRVGFFEKPNSSALLGSMMHQGAYRLVVYGEMLDVEDYLETFYGLLDEYDPAVSPADDDIAIKLATEATIGIRAFERQLLPQLANLDIVASEETLRVPLGEGVDLVGTPDLVTNLVIFDWKTSARSPKPTKYIYRLQAPLYTYAANETYGLNIDTFFFYAYERSATTWFPHGLILNDQNIAAAKASAIAWAKMKEANIFPATPTEDIYGARKRKWYCSPKWCPAWNVCTDKYQIPDGDIDEMQRDYIWE